MTQDYVKNLPTLINKLSKDKEKNLTKDKERILEIDLLT